VHRSPMWSITADFAESKHVGVTCQAGAENCELVLVSPEDHVQGKIVCSRSGLRRRSLLDDSHGVAAAVIGGFAFVLCCIYLVL